MEYDVVHVESVAHLHLRVAFRDGTNGDVIFEKSHLSGVFSVLNDPHFFEKVACDHGFVEWPGELDLAPDAMYQAVKEQGTWVLM